MWKTFSLFSFLLLIILQHTYSSVCYSRQMTVRRDDHSIVDPSDWREQSLTGYEYHFSWMLYCFNTRIFFWPWTQLCSWIDNFKPSNSFIFMFGWIIRCWFKQMAWCRWWKYTPTFVSGNERIPSTCTQWINLEYSQINNFICHSIENLI